MKQEELIQLIKKHLPPHISLPEYIADILQLSTDSAYRRIRGETALTFEEAGMLLGKANINLQWPSDIQKGYTAFSFSPLQKSPEFLTGYLQKILHDLKFIHSNSDANVIYAAADLPLFQHFYFREHAAFKLYYWMRSVMGVPQTENQLFDPANFDSDLLDLAAEVLDAYRRIPSTELWSDASSTVKQIWYYWESGYFKSKKDAVLICEQMIETIEILKKQAEKGNKLPEGGKKALEDNGSFTLYHSEIDIGNNIILVNTNTVSKVYLRHQTFSSIVTTDPEFYDSTAGWVDNLICKSTLISGVSEKARQQYFNKMKNVFQDLILAIEKY